jgi:hypothetical protein
LNWALAVDYIGEKISDPGLYILTLGAGVFINLYGQIVVPWLRGVSPLEALRSEARKRPFVLILSFLLAFLFPFSVGLASGVATRYMQRHIEAHANFPDAKPDPVFCVDLAGKVKRMGARTRAIFGVDSITAPEVLGTNLWQDLLRANASGATIGLDQVIYFQPLDAWFLVAHSPGADGASINIYLTHVSPELASTITSRQG